MEPYKSFAGKDIIMNFHPASVEIIERDSREIIPIRSIEWISFEHPETPTASIFIYSGKHAHRFSGAQTAEVYDLLLRVLNEQ